jgi:hypothetical protein
VAQARLYAILKGFENKARLVIPDTFLCSVSVILLSGYSQLPSKKMYWEGCKDTYSSLVSTNIRRDTFEAILFSTYFVDNAMAAKSTDRFFKVRPIFELINSRSKLYMERSKNMSIDEMMIPYYGKHGDNTNLTIVTLH